MLSTRVIACLDVHNGRTVKGINFVDLQDAGDPAEQAKLYSKVGADEICFLDISATNEKRKAMLDVISKTAESCFVPLTVGGGVNDISDFRNLLNCGADKVSVNSSAVYNPGLIKQASDKFGNQCVVLAIDAIDNKNMLSGYEVTTHGGKNKTDIDVLSWAQKGVENGAGEILLTSMDRDGTKSGYDIELLKIVTKNTNIPVIASGGVGTLDHMYDGITNGGASAVLAASIFHYGEHSIKNVKEYLNSKKVPVRL